MKRLIHLGMILALAWLISLASSALVEGPESAEHAHPVTLPPMAAQVALTAPVGNPQPEHSCASDTTRMKSSLPAGKEQSESTAGRSGVQASDQNGTPVVSRTYIRTVYQAFPPERMAG